MCACLCSLLCVTSWCAEQAPGLRLYLPPAHHCLQRLFRPVWQCTVSLATSLPVVQDSPGGQGGLLSYTDPDAARSGAAAPEASPPAANGDDSNGGAGLRIFLPFEGADVKGRGPRQLKRGDPVEFSITTDARTGKQRATQVPRTFLPAVSKAFVGIISDAGEALL